MATSNSHREEIHPMSGLQDCSPVQRLADRLETHLGLHYSKQRTDELAQKLNSVASDLCYESTAECIEALLESEFWSNQVVASLCKRLTIGETYFFRDPALFAFLGQQLPHLVREAALSGKPLTIWCAACSTGEEPYTVAMLVDHHVSPSARENVRIIGSDINDSFLEKARTARYTAWSFRATPKNIIDEYFTRTATGERELRADIRSMVEFRQINLASTAPAPESIPQCDVILCRNVLIYFSASAIERVLGRLHSKLNPNGRLFVAAQETGVIPEQLFEIERHPGLFSAKKKTHKELAAAAQAQPVQPSVATTACQPNYLTGAQAERSKLPLNQLQSTASAETLQRCRRLYEAGEYGEALKLLIQPEWMLDQNGSAAFALLTNIYANQRNWSEALATNQTAIELSPLDPTLYYTRATILVETEESHMALASLRQCLFIDERFAAARVLSSNLLRLTGRDKDAQEQMLATLQILDNYEDQDILPNCDGMSVATMRSLVNSMMHAAGAERLRQPITSSSQK